MRARAQREGGKTFHLNGQLRHLSFKEPTRYDCKSSKTTANQTGSRAVKLAIAVYSNTPSLLKVNRTLAHVRWLYCK